MAVTTSPGLLALPDGIFSQSGVSAVTLIGSSSLAMDSNAALTVAAPPISAFINPIPAAGLMLIPPLENTNNNNYLKKIKYQFLNKYNVFRKKRDHTRQLGSCDCKPKKFSDPAGSMHCSNQLRHQAD